MFRNCIMKLKWTNSNVTTSPIFDGLLFSTVCFTWYNFSLFWSLNLSEVILWCWICMNDLIKSDLKMSSLNIRTTYHIYYFTFKLLFFVIHFFVTLNLIQTNFGFIVCYDIDNVHIEVDIRGDPGFQVRGADMQKLRRAEGGAKIFGVFRVKIRDFMPKKQITASSSYP